MQDLRGSQTSHAAPTDEDALSLYTPPPELQPFIVPGAPQGTFYIPNFIDTSTEDMLLLVRIKTSTSCNLNYLQVILSSSLFVFHSQKVQHAPKTKWTQLRNRRLQSCWGITRTHYFIHLHLALIFPLSLPGLTGAFTQGVAQCRAKA